MLRAIVALLRRVAPRHQVGAPPEESGQTLVEYALLLFFIAIVVIAALLVLGPTVSGIFHSVNDQIP